MGFWDKVKDVAIAAKCMTGWHGGEYEHIQGRPLCYLGKTCPDCHEYITKTKHDFTEWEYKSYSNCDAVRECIHCQAQEASVIHTYEETGKDSNCRIIKICSRCGKQELGSTQHDWITIPFTDTEIKANGKRKCKDCGYLG